MSANVIRLPDSPASFVCADLRNNPVEPWLVELYGRANSGVHAGGPYHALVALGSLGRLWSISENAMSEFLDISGEWSCDQLPERTVVAWARNNFSAASLRDAEETAMDIAVRHHNAAIFEGDAEHPSLFLPHLRDSLSSVAWMLYQLSNVSRLGNDKAQFGHGLNRVLDCFDAVNYYRDPKRWNSVLADIRKDPRIRAVANKEREEVLPKTWVGALLRNHPL